MTAMQRKGKDWLHLNASNVFLAENYSVQGQASNSCSSETIRSKTTKARNNPTYGFSSEHRKKSSGASEI